MKRSVFSQVSDQVLLPVLSDFIQWVIRSAAEEGVGRLYFLARDGYPMYLAAQMFLSRKVPQIECRYLFCSRFSLRVPCFHLKGRDALKEICLGGIDVTLRKVLHRAALTEEEIVRTAEGMGLSGELDRILSYQEVQRLIPRLEKAPGFLELLEQHSREAYQDTMEYLRQEGLLDPIPCAVVDSGWTGTVQQTLDLLRESGGCGKKLTGYYFGLYSLPKGSDFSGYHAYYFSPKGHIKRKVLFSNSLFEGIMSAPHGMTLGYRKEGETFKPVLKSQRNENQERILAFRDGLIPYMVHEERKLPKKIADWTRMDPKSQRRLFGRLARFMAYPTREEARVFGSLKFTDDVLENGEHQLAARLEEEDIKRNHALAKSLILLGIRKGPIRESAWMEGSIVQNGRRVRCHLRGNRRYKYLLYLKKYLGSLGK